jgi:hypothetical protein
VILNENLAWIMSLIVVVLLLTYLVTSADSAVLIINTINAAGDEGPKARPHILFWGAALALVVGALIVAGGLGAIQTAMVIGALPIQPCHGPDGTCAGQGDLARRKAAGRGTADDPWRRWPGARAGTGGIGTRQSRIGRGDVRCPGQFLQPKGKTHGRQPVREGSGVPPLKWSTNWGRFAPFFGGPGDGWEAREA